MFLGVPQQEREVVKQGPKVESVELTQTDDDVQVGICYTMSECGGPFQLLAHTT